MHGQTELVTVEAIQEESKALIVLEQLPVIRQRLEARSIEIKKDVEDALAMICTEETIASVKKTRAKLTADKTALEAQRIQISKEIMKPYDAFYAIYKEKILDPYIDADAKLKAKIDALESERKLEKEREAMRYFAELCEADKVDFVTFDQLNLNITLTVTPKALKNQIRTFLEKVVADLELISVQGEAKNEILVEYKKSLNVSRSIMDVNVRRKALEIEKQREEERAVSRDAQNARIAKIDTLIPTSTEAPRVVRTNAAEEFPAKAKEYFATFKAFGTIEQLKGIKAYLVANNIRFENVPVPAAPTNTVSACSEPVTHPVSEPEKDSRPVAFVQFRNKEGGFSGREYSYIIPKELELEVVAGSLADVATRSGIGSALVTRLGTTAEIAADIIPKLLKIEGISKEEEGDK